LKAEVELGEGSGGRRWYGRGSDIRVRLGLRLGLGLEAQAHDGPSPDSRRIMLDNLSGASGDGSAESRAQLRTGMRTGDVNGGGMGLIGRLFKVRSRQGPRLDPQFHLYALLIVAVLRF